MRNRAWLFLVLVACTDSVDRAAKKRIFSPEDPPKAVSKAKDSLPPQDVADDPVLSRRVLRMGAAEATERIGPHRYTAQVTFEWTTIGNRTARLNETRTLVAGPGGVAGDFHGTLENSRDLGLEVLRVRGQVFARNRYHKFRQRLRDRGMAEREREELYGAVRDFDDLFRGRLKLTARGTATHEGRLVWKYDVSLGAPPPEDEDAPHLPPPFVPRSGQDDTTRRRLHFAQAREPRSLVGEVWVDAETSVVIRAKLEGRLGVPSDAGEASLRLVLDAAMTDVGKDPSLKAPAEFLPDQDKPEGIADALERFGIRRSGTDGGASFEPEDEG